MSPTIGSGSVEVECVQLLNELGDDFLNAACFLSIGGLFEGVPKFFELGGEFPRSMHDAVAHFVAHA